MTGREANQGRIASRSDTASLEDRLRRAHEEAAQAIEQQGALSEILGAISSSIADTKPVFEKILASCHRLFEGHLVGITLVSDDGGIDLAAYDGPRADDLRRIYPLPLSRESGSGAAILDGTVKHYPDAESGDVPKGVRDGCGVAGMRSILFAPLLNEGRGIGALWVGRLTAGAFSEKQVALLKTFADQAVIAIQNARLFNETREALEQQTATAEILKVISRSPADVQPVFDAIVQSGARLFAGAAVAVALPDAGQVRAAAIAGADPEQAESWRGRFPFPLNREYMHGAAILDRRVVDIPDAQRAGGEFAPGLRNFLASGYRAATIMPMIRGDAAIGAISVLRKLPGPLREKQVALLRTFADQAVIAIENVRLFNETREALDFQKTSSEILASISGSIADTQPVFDAIVKNLMRLFGTRFVVVQLLRGSRIEVVALHGEPGFERLMESYPRPLDDRTVGGLAMLSGRALQLTPVLGNPESPPVTVEFATRFGFNSLMAAPLTREDQVIGAIVAAHRDPVAFDARQVALIKTFADQAVIAIQNASLFREIQEKSRQLEIANRHKSQFLANMSHELRTPLNAIIGFTRIVMRRSQSSLAPKQYENLEKILASGQNLLALINAILDLSKVEAGRVEVDPAEIGLAPVLEQCIRTIEPLVKAESVALAGDFQADLPRMHVDEEKLRQIVINLLSNAAKFTATGSIRVRAAAAGGLVEIAVVDTGIGIPADKIGLIFEEFQQADASSTRIYGGTGLGLTIARRLARLMGGDIRAESAPGSGSTFTLTLPVRYQPPAE